MTPKVGQSTILLSEVQGTRLNSMGEWLAQQVREKAAEKQERRRREIELDEARCQMGAELEAREKEGELRKRAEAGRLLRASWAAQARAAARGARPLEQSQRSTRMRAEASPLARRRLRRRSAGRRIAA